MSVLRDWERPPGTVPAGPGDADPGQYLTICTGISAFSCYRRYLVTNLRLLCSQTRLTECNSRSTAGPCRISSYATCSSSRQVALNCRPTPFPTIVSATD